MAICKVLLTVMILGVLTLGIGLGTFGDSDSSESSDDGDSAFALTCHTPPTPTALS